MKKVKHTFILGFILGLLLLNANDVQATHIMGGDLTYTCTGNNTYNLQLRLFRDCNGISLGNTATVNFTSPTCGSFATTLTLLAGYPQDITPVCPSVPTACNGGSGAYGVEEYVYKGTITLTCVGNYTLSWSSCCRNGTGAQAITTLQNPGSQGFYINTLLDNSLTPCNNTPDFLNSPVAYFCANQPVNYNHGATDFDGDSLVFSLVNCQQSGGSVNYLFPFSGTSPLATTSGVSIDPSTGALSFTPNVVQVGVLCVKVEEYRNNVKIGEIVRDMQFAVIPCTNLLPVASGINGTADSSGTSGVFNLSVCAGDTINFDIQSFDMNISHVFDVQSNYWQSTQMNWNTGIPGASFTTDGANPPTGNFFWVPSNADVGTNLFTVDIRDDACPVIGVNIYSFNIFVNEKPEMDAGPAQITCSPGDSVMLNPTFTANTLGLLGNYDWSPSTYLADSTLGNTMAGPDSTITYTANVSYNNGCSYKDNVIIEVTDGITLPAMTDTTICKSDSAALDATIPINSIGTSYLNDSLKAIQDNDPTGAYSYINVSGVSPAAMTATTIERVCINMSHDFAFGAGDLDIYLVSPDGAVMELSTDNGGANSAPYTNTCFTPSATNFIGSAATPYTGDYQPEGSFSSFIGNSTNGVWKLWVIDDQAGFTHKIVDWSITFADPTSITYSWSPTNGLSCTTCPDPMASPLDTTTYVVTATDQNGCIDIDSVTVNVIDTLAAPSVICAGTTPFSLIFSWNSIVGASGYEVNVDNGGWITPSGPGLTHVVTGLAVNQTVNIQVRGIANCPGGAFIGTTDCTTGLCVNANVNNTTNVTCNGGNDGAVSVSANSGTAPYQYSLNGGSFAPTGNFSGLSAGNQFVIVTDAFNCLDTAFFTITEPAAISTAMSTDSVSCYGGSDGTASVAILGGTAPHSFNWSNGGTTQALTGLTIGTYIVTVTDVNNCSVTDSVLVEQPDSIFLSSVSTDVSCNGAADGSITVSAIGGNGGYSYNWTGTSSTTNIAASLSGGIYSVQVTDNEGCTTSIIDTVNENTAIVLGQTSIPALCNASADGMAIVTATDGAGGYTYLWDANALNQVTDTAFNLAAGTYTVTVTDADGCTQPISATVTSPPVLSTAMNSSPTSCHNSTDGTGTIIVTGGTAPYSYSWQNAPNDTTATATGLAPGFQAVTVTDANGCQIVDSVQVTSPVPISITLTPTAVSCFGVSDGSIIANVTGGAGGYSYVWDGTTSTLASVNGLAGGLHTVTVTDANSCQEIDTVTITVPDSLIISLTKTDVLCFNGSDGSATVATMGGTSPYTYLWSPSGQMTPIASNIPTGWHSVMVTDANNCITEDSIFVPQPAIGVSTSMNMTELLCNGDGTGTATVVASGGSGNYTYSWSHNTSLNSPNATNLQAGTYGVTVSDGNNCDYVDSIPVTEPPALNTSIMMTPTSCNGYADGTATVSVTGGVGGYNYIWLPTPPVGANDSMASGLIAGLYGVSITDANGCITGDTITVTEPAGMTLTMSMTEVSCHSGSDGAAAVSVTGGTGVYTYAWSNSPSTTNSANNVSVGWHAVTVTDANGCFKADSILVTEPDTLIVTLTAVDVSCFGGADGSATAAPLGGVGNYTYLWSPSGQTTQTATNLQSGIHTVTVTDGNGCIATASIFVDQPASGIATVTSMTEVLCNGGNTGTATVVATGGAGNYSYLWSSGDVTPTAVNLAAGGYTVTITDQNGCFVTDNITVDEPSPILLIVGHTPTSCFGGDDGTATVVGSGGVPNADGSYIFSWNSSPIQYDVTTATSLNGGQIYTVTAQDENGCIETADVTITQPTEIQLTTVQENVSCHSFTDGTANVTASGGTPGFRYVWSNGDSSALASNLGHGSYTVTVTDFNDCEEEVAVLITEPAPLSATSNILDVVCKGEATGEVMVLAAGGTPWYSFAWSDGRNGNEQENLLAGNYIVTLTDANGCELEHNLSVAEPAVALAANLSPSAVSCFGERDGEILVNAGGGLFPYQYSADGEVYTNSNILVGLTGGSYPVHVRDDAGCVFIDTIVVDEPAEMVVNAGPDLYTEFREGVPIVVSVQGGQFPLFYSWTPGDSSLSCLTCPVPIASPDEDQFYQVMVTDANGCVAYDEVAVRVEKIREIFVATGFTPNGDGVNDDLFIQGGEHSDRVVSFEVFDRWGERVFLSNDTELNDPAVGWDGRFRGEVMNTGVYGWIAEIEFADGERIVFKGNTTLIR